MTDDESLKLDELAERAGVSPRTVRFYVQRGLLPPPVFRGKDSSYSREHLLRLRAIQRLKDRFLPLPEIQKELSGKTLAELEALPDLPPRPPIRRPIEPAPRTYERWTLASGLELHLASDASEETRRLAHRLRLTAESPERKESL